MANLKVIQINSAHDSSATLHLVNYDKFQDIELSECYNKNGQKYGEEYKNLWVKALTYHDGHNWQTLILGENYQDWNEAEEIEEELEKEILEDLNNKKSIGEGGGCQYYQGKKYWFTVFHWTTNNWEVYAVDEIAPKTHDFKYEFIGLQYLIIHLKGSCSKYQGEFWGHEWSDEAETAINWAMENFGVENGKMCHPREEKNENCIYFEL
jgi:hypothetical protein